MIKANFSSDGLDVGHNNVNMTYLYGLGDFFHVMFEDVSSVNLLLEADSQVAGEIYNRFLQLTSTMSLEEVQTSIGSSIKLVLLNASSRVSGEVNTFLLPEKYVSAKYVANRPLLPTEVLETDVDFRIDVREDGTSTIRFASDIDTYLFSSRVNPNTAEKQYAIWVTDAHIDEQLISNHFGNLIGVDAAASDERFANFVYGLYYVYINGPTLTSLRKGLNLTLGIPLARSAETVIDIRSYLQTDQYLVITDQNTYLVPYGLLPTVSVGDALSVGDELAQWVEIKDYIHDGDWWLNLYIPRNLVPTVPPGQESRYARAGTSLDYLMRNYLKKHTFLVNIKVSDFQKSQQYVNISDIINRAKPAYTQMIYVWTVGGSYLQEDITADDGEGSGASLSSSWEEDVNTAFKYMRRNSSTTLRRGTSRFIRFNAPEYVTNPVGEDPYTNSGGIVIDGTAVQSISNSVSLFRENTRQEVAWIDTINNRCSDTWRGTRGQIGYRRRLSTVNDRAQPWFDSELDINGPTINGPDLEYRKGLYGHSVPLSALYDQVPEGMKLVPLTVMLQDELEAKCTSFNITPPGRYEHVFLIKPASGAVSINSHAINSLQDRSASPALLYPDMFRRDGSLDHQVGINEQCMREFLPAREDILDDDILIGFRINCDVIGMYLLTSNFAMASPALWPLPDETAETAVISINSAPTRGMGIHGSPFYLARGNLVYNTTNQSINSDEINSSIHTPDPLGQYSDMYNSAVPVNRGGTIINHRVL